MLRISEENGLFFAKVVKDASTSLITYRRVPRKDPSYTTVFKKAFEKKNFLLLAKTFGEF